MASYGDEDNFIQEESCIATVIFLKPGKFCVNRIIRRELWWTDKSETRASEDRTQALRDR